ncbi:MAG: aminotransferase class V-fold PLP-dependent enzyme [Actinomycetota bacterium]|jgi:cysteine desulfurase
MSSLYFDHAASAPRRPEVLEAMLPWTTGVVGNPAGTHSAARRARRAIEDARDEVADFLGVTPTNTLFTAGGTESCHLAIAGTVQRFRRSHANTSVVVSAFEHHAVLTSAELMESLFDDVTTRLMPVGADGCIELDSLTSLVDASTAVVSVMAVNNETGIIQPLEALRARLDDLGTTTLVHTDAIAAAPWMDVALSTASAHLISLCAHKLGGPVNAGALGLRDATIEAVVPGGAQERGLRGGTVDVAAAVGLAMACRLTRHERVANSAHCRELQVRLQKAMTAVEGVSVTGESVERVPGTVHLLISGVSSDEVLFLLDQAGVSASAGAACSSGATSASHVMTAMGVRPELARGSLRLSMGGETTHDDVDALASILTGVIARLRPSA